MRQIIHALRCLTIALLLVAAFVTLTSVEHASAETWTIGELERFCKSEQGSFVLIEYASGTVTYSCAYPENDQTICTHIEGDTAPYCTWMPAPEPEPHIGDPLPNSWQLADGQVADQNQNAPAPSAPTGSSRSGFEYKMIER